MKNQRKLVSAKKLEMLLQEIESFTEPKLELEQYPLTPRGATFLLSIINNTYNDIKDKTIGDFGCGTGILAIGSAILGAKEVIGVEIDQKQLDIAIRNAEKLHVNDKIQWFQLEIQNFSMDLDVIIQNPPFGVQSRRGIDTVFLSKAIESAKVVYSLHKSGETNQNFLQSFIRNQDALVNAIIPIQILIPHLYKFHKKSNYPVQVDLYRILS